eukprot:NODE_5_length_72347_cov_1.339331.p30 type:complete len:268 gc:universal NODE_5_length_72347_cov_1.339331:23457-24260(+)
MSGLVGLMNRPQPDEISRFVNKFLQDTEKNMNTISKNVDNLVTTEKKVRKHVLHFSSALKTCADTELPQTRLAMAGISEALQDIQAYRKIMYDTIESRVQQPLQLYKTFVAKAKDDLKSRESARKRETEKQTLMEKLAIKETNRAKITKGHLELAGANHEMFHTSLALAEHVDSLEAKKITDIRAILKDYLTIQMEFHCRSLEVLTDAVGFLDSCEMENDLGEIRERMRTIGLGDYNKQSVYSYAKHFLSRIFFPCSSYSCLVTHML